ncbi:uncharacterized protein G2W53_007661 [Senna tora]|uniref:Uncharacterized protein n=1 Tax=Senna tora TaxID=362788 RepID=A0A834X7P1_9FABA|nr:uncharacterized protein G2W53_007661 [Senna tora]
MFSPFHGSVEDALLDLPETGHSTILVLWKGMQVSSEEYAKNRRIPTKSLGLLAENRKEKHYNHLQCSGYHEMVVLCSTRENFQVLYSGVLSCACPY